MLQVNLSPMAPSAIRVKGVKFLRSEPVEMSISDIKDVIQKFRISARATKHAGFTGVQVHGAHGYCKLTFLFPSISVLLILCVDDRAFCLNTFFRV